MLNEILNRISAHLQSSRRVLPLVSADARPSRWAATPGLRTSPDSDAPEALRRHHLAILTGMAAQPAPDMQAMAHAIHTLLNAATWSDTSAGDPYEFDPCIFDDAFAETACALACALNVHRRALTQISPRLPERIETELDRRVSIPLSQGSRLPEISLQGCCLLLCTALLGCNSESARWTAIQRLCRAIDQKLNRLPADGSMPGGIEAATQTAILLMDTAEVLLAATENRIDITRHERIVCMADYPLFAHLQSGWFVNPGDHSMTASLDAESLFRFGHLASDTALCDLSAWLLRNDRSHAPAHLLSRLLNRRTARALEETPGRIRLFRDGFLPDAGLMFMRGFHLHISMTGATGTSHADAGNICLFRREQPVLVDIGPGAAETCLHSLPTINGIGQTASVSPGATECGDGGEATTCYTVNLTAAYPPSAKISDYQRTLLMGAANAPGIRLMDMLELTEPAPVDFHFICACEPAPSPDGMKIGPVLLQWSSELTPEIEHLPQFKRYRLTLHAEPARRQQHVFDFIPE